MTSKDLFRTLAWRGSRAIAHKCGIFSDVCFSLASIYVRSYNNLNYDMASNGELAILDKLAKSQFSTIFDVGANVGEYSLACSERMPSAMVHAFEIALPTFRVLSDKIGAQKNITIHNVGLSDRCEEVEVFYNREHDGASSMVCGVSGIHPEKIDVLKCRVITGDDYCSLNRIESIDLLKIDVEGAENLVLKGFSGMFAKGAISCVQFEFGLANIYSRFLLNDFWHFLSGCGFELGPIMPDGVVFKNYDPRDENFEGAPNYFAIQRKRQDLIHAVRSSRRVGRQRA